MNNQRTTPYGLWRYGSDFYKAANSVLIQHNSEHFMPYYFLIGQSIELSLKAFLLADGMQLSTLRKSYGHDLRKLITTSVERNIIDHVPLEDSHVAVMDLMTDEYLERRYQYIKTGMMQLPHIPLVHTAAELLSINLEGYCRDAKSL